MSIIKISGVSIRRTAAFAVLLLFSNFHDSIAQWKLLGTFDSQEGWPVSIQSLFGDSILLVGLNSDGVERTTDGGNTWEHTLQGAWVSDFAFKNDSDGWLSNENAFDSNLVFHTTDAGLTWNTTLRLKGEAVGIIYQALSDKLFVLQWNEYPSFESPNEGVTWSKFGPALYPGQWFGMAFTNAHHGIYGYPFGNKTIMVTDDDWNSWTNVSYPFSEVWQPLAIPGTDTIVTFSEWQSFATRSLDGGLSWSWDPPDPTIWMTGGLAWCDCGSVIIAQAAPMKNVRPGVFYSSDLGVSWASIGGPSNYYDTRLFYSGHYIYAGSYVPQASMYEVWRYEVHHYPSLSSPSRIHACSNFDTTMHISFTNTCFGIPASLDSVAITGSSAFSFAPLTLPHLLASEEDLALLYSPRLGLHDTARIYLRFNQHGDMKDTVIWVYGNAAPERSLSLRCTPSVSHAGVGAPVTVGIYPDKITSGIALDTIQFLLAYTGDVLDYRTASSANTITVGAPIKQGADALLPMMITGSDLSLDPSKPIATLTFSTMLSDSLHTKVSLRNLTANPGDPSYTLCALALSTDSSSFSVDLGCSDSILVNYLRNGSMPFQIESVEPNPAGNEMRVHFVSAPSGPVEVGVLDVLGRLHMSREVSGQSATLEVSALPEGVYYLRVSSGGFVETRRVVVRR